MHVSFDTNNNQVTVNLLTDEPVAEIREVGGLIVRYAADRRVVGIEVRGARERIQAAIQHETIPSPA
jgi:uncharacterized protein YuzE